MSSWPRSSGIWPPEARRRYLACAAALLVAAGCAPQDDWVQERRQAMGTWVDTIYAAPAAPVAAALQRELDLRLQHYEIDYYAWADGELSRLNRALAAGATFAASAELANLLRRAQHWSMRSDGYFDPAVGELVEAWGFHRSDAAPGQPPAEFLQRWSADPPGIADLHIDGNLIGSTRALVVDLGGVAKGEIVDQLLEVLRAAGVSDALVDAGGDVRVLGRRGERNWTIGIQAPRTADAVLGAIRLRDGEAAFTSGDYERFVEAGGDRAHHLLDPRSGRPATHTQAVTVIADNGALADAAATAIFVAGPQHWRRVAAALGIDSALRVDAGGAIEMTDAMRERVSMQGAPEPATMQ